jgi:hypothetical protein
MKSPTPFLAATLAIAAPSIASDDTGVRVPLELYLKAHATGDPDLIRKAFHADARVLFVREGKFTILPPRSSRTASTASPPTKVQRKRAIESVDVAGNAASARIKLDYPQTDFTDYMQLLKIDGEWKIVSKTFYAEPTSAAK